MNMIHLIDVLTRRSISKRFKLNLEGVRKEKKKEGTETV